MKKITQLLTTLWKDESGQGATEYILLLVVVVAVVLAFKQRILKAVETQMGVLEGNMNQVGQGNN